MPAPEYGPEGSEVVEKPVEKMDYLRAWRESGGVQGKPKNPLEKALQNPNSRALAIAAKCYDCQGQDQDPGMRWRIGNCVGTGCPLEPVRPYQHLLGSPEPAALRGE